MRLVVLVAIAIGCSPSRPSPASGSNSTPCTNGATQCEGNMFEACIDGTFVTQEVCPLACSDGIGCTTCVAGTTTCDGNASQSCNADGSGFQEVACDASMGESCDPNNGQCVVACAPDTLGASYIGCEYYPTVTGNAVGNVFDFAVAISNTWSTPAHVTIDGGALVASVSLTVQPGAVAVQTLPWQPDLKLCNTPEHDGCDETGVPPGALVAKGAYHLVSDDPVTVYQFNSLEYAEGADFSFSNDASLLLPTNTWRMQYYAAAWKPEAPGTYPSELAVTAVTDDTTVTITSKADSVAGSNLPEFSAGVAQSITLGAGDAVELTSMTGDFTGSLITSDKPIQVISGHFCTTIPDNVAACDHLEESMFPVDTLGVHYIVNAPAVTTIPDGKFEVIRIVATTANTSLTYDPPQPGAPASLANPGDFIEIDDNANSFSITADQKVLVAQYMESQAAGGDTGDPSMALAVPVEQFRTAYTFHAPTSYETNYVDITAPAGVTVLLDGLAVPVTAPIGNTGYVLSRVTPLGAGPGNDGNHTITSSQPFGISVYGYGQYTSYWYPGGLDLRPILQ